VASSVLLAARGSFRESLLDGDAAEVVVDGDEHGVTLGGGG